MFLENWISKLQAGLTADFQSFGPELVICAGIVLLVLLRLFRSLDRIHLGSIAFLVTAAAIALSVDQWQSAQPITNPVFHRAGGEMFGGMLAYDTLTIFLRLVLYSFTALVILLTLLTGIPDREDSADFYSLLLGAALGMSIMASANHLLMIFIGVEMASLPSYGLAGFLKGRRQSSEAALKYVVYGGGASGVMLYGISLLAGKFGTGYVPALASGFGAVMQARQGGFDVVLLLGTLFILIGIGFKLAAFPFHFWCPDVFEGASAEVAAFLSVASKGAALALLGRFVLMLAGLGSSLADYSTWLQMAHYLAPPLALFAALTATFGNLAAYVQTNLKRLLAYSTIAQAGYMMMGVAAFTAEGMSAVLFYLVAYLFMNLGAFAVVAFLRNQTGSEDLNSFRGLIQRSPMLVVTLAFFLLSLLGVPPLVGFAAKFQIFRVLYDAGVLYAGRAPGLSYTMYALLVIGGLNTVLSLFYYIKVLKVMILDRPLEEIEGVPPASLPLSAGKAAYATVLAVVVLLLGIFWDASPVRIGGKEVPLPSLARASEKGVDRFYTAKQLIDRTANQNAARTQGNAGPRPRPRAGGGPARLGAPPGGRLRPPGPNRGPGL
jgi:NADH-quinone oxidoreductase subunit N